MADIADPDDFTVVTPTDKHIWAKMFVEYFLGDLHCSLPQCSAQADDMLWYSSQVSLARTQDWSFSADGGGGKIPISRTS